MKQRDEAEGQVPVSYNEAEGQVPVSYKKPFPY